MRAAMIAQWSVGGGRHEVEDGADGLQRGGDVVEVRVVLARVEQLDGQPEPLAHGGGGHPVHVVDDLGRLDLAQRGAGGLGPRGEASGGEVVEFMVVARGADAGGGDRAEADDGVDEVVGDLIQLGARA